MMGGVNLIHGTGRMPRWSGSATLNLRQRLKADPSRRPGTTRPGSGWQSLAALR